MEPQLTLVALDRVREGAVPSLTEFRTFGGHGSGGMCAVCGHGLPRSGMEIEVEHQENARLAALIMHVQCYDAWVEALRQNEIPA